MITTRGTLVGALTLGMAVALSLPVQAVTDWSGPQQISSRYGSQLTLSDDGSIAVWIRTDSMNDYEPPSGPVRTSRYRGTKKGWAKSAEIPGTTETSGVQLSGDGATALIERNGGGYAVSERLSGTTWSMPEEIAAGTRLYGGEMSSDGNTVAWVDYGPPTGFPVPPGALRVRTRAPDGTWDPPVTLGTIPQMAEWRRDLEPVLSRNGSTVAWLDNGNALRAAVRNSSGTWTPTSVIKQYPTLPYVSAAELSASGQRIIWTRDGTPGVLTAVRSGYTWSAPSYVTVTSADQPTMSPKGSIVAWVAGNERLLVRQWKNDTWNKPVDLGSAREVSPIAMTNTTIAWATPTSSKSILRTATLSKGNWTVSGKIAKDARGPALSLDSGTLAWSATQSLQLLSAKR